MSLLMDKLKENGTIKENKNGEIVSNITKTTDRKELQSNVLPTARKTFLKNPNTAKRQEVNYKDFMVKTLPTVADYIMRKKIGNDATNIIENTGIGAYNGVLHFAKQINDVASTTHEREKSLFDKTNEKFGVPNVTSKYQQGIVNNLSSANKNLSNSIRKNEELIKRNVENASNPVTQKLTELAPSIGQMLPGFMPGVGSAYFAGSAASQYTDEGLERGMTKDKARTYGGVMGLLEGGTETLGAWLTKGVGKAIRKGNLSKALKTYGLDIAENTVEESIIEPISETTALLVGGKDKADFSNMSARMLQAGIDGGLVSAIMGGASLGIGSAINVANKINSQQSITKNEMKTAIEDIKASKKIDVEQEVIGGIRDAINGNDVTDHSSSLQTEQLPVNNEKNRVIKKNTAKIDEPVTNILASNEMPADNKVEKAPTANLAPSELIRAINQRTNNNIELDVEKLPRAKAKLEGNKITLDYEKGGLEEIIHETTHYSESNSKGYEVLSNHVLTELEKSGELKNIKDELRQLYKEQYAKENRTFTEQDLESEVVAKYTERFINDEIFVNKMANTDKTLTQRIYNWIKDKINYYKKIVKMEPEQKIEYDNLRKAEKLWEKALKGVEKNNNITNVNKNLEYINKFKNATKKVNREIVSNLVDKLDIKIKVGSEKVEDIEMVKKSGHNVQPKIVNIDKIFENLTENNKKNLRKEAINKALSLFRNKFVEIKDIKDIAQIRKEGITKTFSGNVTNEKIQSANNIDNIVQEGIYKYTTKSKDTDVGVLYHHFFTPVNYDGENGIIRIVIKEDRNDSLSKNRFYYHQFEYLNNIKEESSSVLTSKSPDKNFEPNSSFIANSIPQKDNTVNTNNMQKSKNNTVPTIKNNKAPRYSFEKLESSSSFSMEKIKEKQLEIIKKYNPVYDDYHAWIRNIEDIKTFEESLQDSDFQGYDEFTPDYTFEMAQEAIKSGKITVYSSYPIKQGIFVSPSYMEAESYAGTGKVYEKTVKLTDVAWIDPTQGQYANVEDVKYSLDNDENLAPTVSEKTTIETELKKLKNTLIKTYDIKNENKKRLDDIFTQYSENKNTDIFLSELMKFSEYITIEDMNNGKDILRDLKSRRIAVDTKTKEDIANYNDFRKSMFGNLVLTNSGIPIDVHYQELSNIRPDLFPNNIVNPADQLQKIAETVKILKKPYLLKNIIGQEALENDIISTAMNFIENNKIISNIVLGGNDGKTRDVNERHSTRISETTTKRREKAPTTKRPTRKFYTSVKNAPVISEAIKKELKPKEYRKLTNDESMATAILKLNNNPEEESLWRKRDVNKTNSVDVAEGLALLSKYQHEGKYESALEVIDRLAEIGTKGGQQVQLFSLLQRLTPEGMLKYASQSLDRAKEEVEKFKNQKWLDEHAEDYKLNEEDNKFITERMEKVVRMEDGRDKQILLAEISKRVSDKLPPVRGASIKAYMRISMLFNPKTQVRNIAGNMLIAPVNAIADTFATAVDKAVAKKTGIRTKGLTDVKSVVEGTVTGIYKSIDDFKRGIDTRNINADRFEIGNGTRGANFSNKTQLGKAMNSLDRTLSFMLDLGDRPFYESAFLNSINNQMKLNKVSSPTPNMIEIATTEALQRTWQDNNAYTTAVLKIRDILNGKVTKNSKGFRYGIGDLLIPFAKTPANLTKAVVDYSPVGVIKTLASDSRNLINAISRNDKDVFKYQHKFIDNLGKGMAGSLLYIIGYALAKAGIATGENDEDKDVANFMKNTLGIQPYSIKIGNSSFTYDWAQPIAVPVAIMSNYVKYSKDNPDATAITKALNASIIGSEQLLEQSFLTSINNVFNGKNGSVLESLTDEILALPSRGVPTLLKQIADMVDSTQRTTFDKTNKLATVRNKIISKLPVASMMLAPSVDTMGREIKKYGGDNNIFNVFFNPANTNKGKLTESSEEIYNVYKETGDKTIFPIQAPYSAKINGENTALDPYKRAIYQETTGKYTDSSIKSLLKNSNYKNLGNEDKVKVLKSVVEDSNLNAKKEVLEYKTENETQKEKSKETGISLSNMYIYSEIISKMNGKKDVDGNTIRGSKQASMAEYIMAMKNTEEQKNKMLAETTTGENKVTVSDLNSVGLENYTQFLSISNQKSKETYKQLVSTGMNSNELNRYWDNIGNIKGQKDENGNTISGSKKKAVQQYINGLNVSKGEKLLLYASSGNYALTYSEKTELFNYIKSIKGMNNKEKQNLVNSLDCFK